LCRRFGSRCIDLQIFLLQKKVDVFLHLFSISTQFARSGLSTFYSQKVVHKGSFVWKNIIPVFGLKTALICLDKLY
jgi:hypothetical protein